MTSRTLQGRADRAGADAGGADRGAGGADYGIAPAGRRTRSCFLGQPPKTPDNSSVPPPSQGRKANRTERRAAKKRKGRPGVFRALADNPHREPSPSVARIARTSCARMTSSDFTLTRYRVAGDSAGRHPHHPHRGTCPHCRRGFSASPPAGMPPGRLRPRSDGADRAPARHPGDRLRAIGTTARRGVRHPHQRRGDRQSDRPRANPADRQRGDDRGGSSRQFGGGLGRDLGPGRGPYGGNGCCCRRPPSTI